MPLPSTGTYPLSNLDVVSFTFDNPRFSTDKPIFIDPINPSTNFFTHASAKRLVRQLIAGLRAAGLQPNDTVCIHSFNSLVYPLLVLAVIGAGGWSVGTNPSYTRAELSHAVKLARVKFVFAESEILPNMQQALAENGIDVGRRLFVLDTQVDQSVPAKMRSWRVLLDHGEQDWIRFDDETKSRDGVVQLYYTSGTTGLPKCAMTTHRNLVAEHTLFFETSPRSYPVRLVLCMPFFHMGILPQVLVSALREGRSAYVMRRFELEPYMRYHTKYQLTETFMVPPMVVAVVMSGLADENSPNYKPECSMRSVRNGTSGAAPLSGDVQARFQTLLAPGATFTQVWGMTETTSMAGIVPWDIARKCAAGEMTQAWGSVGKPLPMVSMKLVNEEGRDVSTVAGVKGELCVKGPTITKGYFENPTATAASWDSEGYFKTGDVVQVDPDTGLIFVVERVKELIKVRGFQVAPAELEGALTEHPSIVDAAVIGIDDEKKESELPRAYIVKRPGQKLSEDDVHKHMAERLARYKQLTGGVRFVESIPKLPSGKILKRVLREQAKIDGKSQSPKL